MPTACLAVLVAGLGAAALSPRSALAEWATGNSLNPAGTELSRTFEKIPMSALRATRRRTPSGFLHPVPPPPIAWRDAGRGIAVRGSIDAGYLGTTGDTQEARFQKYADLDDDPLVNDLVLGLRHSESGLHLDFHALALGRNDESYRAALGRFGTWRVRAFFDRVPHLYATDAAQLFRGVGSENLTLPASLAPGNGDPQDIAAALAAVGPSRLAVERSRGGFRLDWNATQRLSAYASYQRDHRGGASAFGGTHLFAFLAPGIGSVVETTEPIDAVTHEIEVGLDFAGARWRGHLAYVGSIFENRNRSLTWENPFRIVPGAALQESLRVERGRFALAPDNQSHIVRANLALDLPRSSRLLATASWETRRQDDDLLPPTVGTGVRGVGPDLDSWNTTAALARQSADARIDGLLLDLELRTRPLRRLSAEARFRYYDEATRTEYAAFNPGASAYGYIAEDGGLGATLPGESGVFEPGVPGSRIHFRSIPFGHRRINFELSSTWRPRPKNTLRLSYERENIRREVRERDETFEDRVRAAFTSRAASLATFRLAYEFRDRRGTDYRSNPYEGFYSSSLPGYVPAVPAQPPHTLEQLRKFDLADRTRHQLDGRVNLLLGDAVDFALGGRLRREDFDADYGLTRDDGGNLNAELSLQPSPDFDAYVFGGLEARDRDMAAISSVGAISSDGNAGGPVYPLANQWKVATELWTWSAGAGFELRIARFTLQSDYTFLETEERVLQSGGPGALAPGTTVADVGAGLPTLRYADHVLESQWITRLTDAVAVRIFHRYHRSRIQDFSQTGLAVLEPNRLFLGHIDRDFSAHVIGGSLQVRL